jgi:hypothetical protein
MKNTLITIGQSLLVLVGLDITILMFSLLQLGVEGRTGEWSPFWMEQARFIIGLIS